MPLPRTLQGAQAVTVDEHTRLMVRIARMYHEQGMRQADIASELHVSQPRVSRLLKRAGEVGIVRTTVSEPVGVFTGLETALEERYGLAEAVVVDAAASYDEVRPIASAAAAYLETTLIGGDSIGISSWSATLLAMVDMLRPFNSSVASSVVQLVGGVGQSQVQVEANRLLTQLAVSLGAEPHFLPAPGLVGSVAARETLMADEAVSRIAEQWNDLTVVLVGIGALEPSPLLQRSGNALPEADQHQLRELGAVGDVCQRFFDADGQLVHSDLDQRVIGIGPDVLRAIPRRVGIAGGVRKTAALRGALRGQWVNVLITDVDTARALVEEDE
ncbi:sugar-binding transcriptional regulator [Demequina capsici]|uniref:Sugar-binding transcriptional regulator n=1 Tax=Demequina capsici TaxID=3075620 RepID=A0AA96FB81_9MICO|nr:sugar-binding transcriptional regulator [Demequina sp. PMTSA13]WNM27576.1 sugar-binding transcriptional regulator [Demequina sp. PMTSA13]